MNFIALDGNGTTTIDHPAAFNFTNWEIGNEVYGSWEMDEHGAKGDALPMPGSSTPKAHDPTTLISFAKQFQTAINTLLHDGMESGASPISIGYDSQAVDNSYGNWIAETLQQSASQGLRLASLPITGIPMTRPGMKTMPASWQFPTTFRHLQTPIRI